MAHWLDTNASSSTFNSTTFAATSTLSINTGAATINGGTFHGPIDINMSGAGNTTGTGNATFNSTVKFTNSGTGYFRTNGNMTLMALPNLWQVEVVIFI
ncbi:MAG: hypothetical protein IPO32_00725 [Crocinitomicaceae bacterium]|nr:hypothetical protein [Crocinitomicaceae bacterium]